MTSGFIRGAAKAIAKNGKKAAKAVVNNGSNGNGLIKNGAEALVPKGVKLRPKLKDLHSGDLAREQAVKQRLTNINSLRKIDDRAEVFDVDKVSDRYSQFLNKPKPRGDDKIYPKEAGAKYLQEAKDYWDEHRTFAGFKRYIDPETGVPTHRIKDGSTFLKKTGQRSAKPKRLEADSIEQAQRSLNEAEQTFEPSARDRLTHHRAELSFFEAIARGLSPSERRKFYEFIHRSDRWYNLKLGDGEMGLIGSVDDADFRNVHVDAHKLLKMAGLNPHTTDFTGATLKQRYNFLDEVAPLLDQIDEFVYSQRMSGKYPRLRHTSGPLKGQKKFKGYRRPTDAS